MILNSKLKKAFDSSKIDTLLYDGKKQDEGKICLVIEINNESGFYWSKTIKIPLDRTNITIGEFSDYILNELWSKFDIEETVKSYEQYLGEADGCETEENIINNVLTVEKKLDELMDNLSKLFDSKAKMIRQAQERDKVS